MSGKELEPKVKARRLLVRLGLVLVYVAALALLFVGGKGHTILVDNKASEDGALAALEGALVSIDGREALELYPGDRVLENVKSQSHRIAVEDLTGAKLVDRRFAVPIGEDILILSVPRLVAGKEPFLEKFVQKDVPLPAGESVGNTNAFTSPDAPVPEGGAPVAPPAP